MRVKLSAAGVAGASFLSVLMAGASALAATPTPDARDARIQQLEDEVRQLAADDQALADRDRQLAAEVEALKTEQATQGQTLATVAAKPAPPPPPAQMASIAGGKPQIASPDGRFSANFHGILQFDTADYMQSGAGPLSTDLRRSGPALGASTSTIDFTHARQLKDGDDFRRARIGVDGVVYGDFDYKLIFDFAGTGVENTGQLYEAWVQYSGLKPLHLRVGAFAPSIGLEDQGSTNAMPLLERSAAEDIARGLAAGDTRTAVALWGSGDHWLASGAVTGRVIGVLNTGTATAVPQTYADQLGLVGRLAATPFYGSDWLVHVGVHGSYVIDPANSSGPGSTGPAALSAHVIALSNTQELRVDGTKLINTGNIDANHASTVGLELAGQKQNFYIQSEYEQFNVSRTDPGLSSPVFHGYYVEGSWVLTGEARKYNTQTAAFDAPAVNHPFTWGGGGMGAFELAARYSDMDLNYHAGALGAKPAPDAIRGGEEQNWSVGLNWYPNSVVRFMLDYQWVKIDRLSPCSNTGTGTSNTCTGTLSTVATWQTPVGAQIGQSYGVVSLRSQFAF
jgi:phosphate-selective porin OprO/OprP